MTQPLHIETVAVQSGGHADEATGAVVPPLHLATTFRHGPAGERVSGYHYQREGNPTRDRLETALAELEGGVAALTFASGMAAITNLLESLPAQSRVLLPDDCYIGLQLLARGGLPGNGLVFDFVDMGDLEHVEHALHLPAAMLWAETPSNPLMKIADIQALADLAHQHGARLVCDNTFATPVLQQPLALGADVVVHSTSKYFGGHSDVLGGALIFAHSDDLHARCSERLHLTGAVMAPFNAWLTLRGCRSLVARMRMHCDNARRLAEFLHAQEAVALVHYPGLETHPGHDIARRQMRDFGGMLSIELRGGREAALAMAGRLHLFVNATSLGGCESLVEHRASAEGPASTTPPGLLRVSVGLEHPDDLIADLEQALAGG